MDKIINIIGLMKVGIDIFNNESHSHEVKKYTFFGTFTHKFKQTSLDWDTMQIFREIRAPINAINKEWQTQQAVI